jgi:hypothetical protein
LAGVEVEAEAEADKADTGDAMGEPQGAVADADAMAAREGTPEMAGSARVVVEGAGGEEEARSAREGPGAVETPRAASSASVGAAEGVARSASDEKEEEEEDGSAGALEEFVRGMLGMVLVLVLELWLSESSTGLTVYPEGGATSQLREAVWKMSLSLAHAMPAIVWEPKGRRWRRPTSVSVILASMILSTRCLTSVAHMS